MKAAIDDALEDLEAFLEAERPDRAQILAKLRETPLPFICCYDDALSIRERFDLSVRFLHTLGRHNLALAVGLCMNQYVAFSISCLPFGEGSALHAARRAFLQRLLDRRCVLAVSSFDDFARPKGEQPRHIHGETLPDGSVRVRGVKNFQSNITGADGLLFTGFLDGANVGLFFTLLDAPERIVLGDPVFSGAMADADTRPLTMTDLVIPAGQVLLRGADLLALHGVTRVVFSAMAMAPYLGGAHRALAEACAFLHRIHVDGSPLASLDGFVTDLGRAGVRYQLCEDLIERFSHGLEALPRDGVEAWVAAETPKALALKHHVTAECEALVDLSRRVIGTRAMHPSHIVSRLSEQVRYAALHPVIGAKIEREMGQRLLSAFA